MPTGSVRTAAKRRLVAMLQAAGLADVDIIYAWDPAPDRDHIRVGVAPTSGDSSVPTMKAGRKFRDDRFGISVVVLASKPGREQKEADEAAERLMVAVESAIAENSLLQFGVEGPLDGVVAATVGDMDGPDIDPGGSNEGALAYGRLVVNVHARLT